MRRSRADLRRPPARDGRRRAQRRRAAWPSQAPDPHPRARRRRRDERRRRPPAATARRGRRWRPASARARSSVQWPSAYVALFTLPARQRAKSGCRAGEERQAHRRAPAVPCAWRKLRVAPGERGLRRGGRRGGVRRDAGRGGERAPFARLPPAVDLERAPFTDGCDDVERQRGGGERSAGTKQARARPVRRRAGQREVALQQVDGAGEGRGGRRCQRHGVPRTNATPVSLLPAREHRRRRRRIDADFGRRLAVAPACASASASSGGNASAADVAATGNALPSARRTKPSRAAGGRRTSAIRLGRGEIGLGDRRARTGARRRALRSRKRRDERAARRSTTRTRPSGCCADTARWCASGGPASWSSSAKRRRGRDARRRERRQRDDRDAHLRCREHDLDPVRRRPRSRARSRPVRTQAPASSNSAQDCGAPRRGRGGDEHAQRRHRQVAKRNMRDSLLDACGAAPAVSVAIRRPARRRPAIRCRCGAAARGRGRACAPCCASIVT